MAEVHRNNPEETDLEAPDGLISDLRTLFTPRQAVPPAVDEAVLARARRQMVVRRRRRMVLRWALPPAAAAAVILWFVLGPFLTPGGGRTVTAQDIDGNGRVNILDALALARNIKSDQVADQPWDFNGDGEINRKDVDTVAMSAVSLNKGTS